MSEPHLAELLDGMYVCMHCTLCANQLQLLFCIFLGHVSPHWATVQPCLTNADRMPERTATETVDERATAYILHPHSRSPHNACTHIVVTLRYPINRINNLQQGNANIDLSVPYLVSRRLHDCVSNLESWTLHSAEEWTLSSTCSEKIYVNQLTTEGSAQGSHWTAVRWAMNNTASQNWNYYAMVMT